METTSLIITIKGGIIQNITSNNNQHNVKIHIVDYDNNTFDKGIEPDLILNEEKFNAEVSSYVMEMGVNSLNGLTVDDYLLMNKKKHEAVKNARMFLYENDELEIHDTIDNIEHQVNLIVEAYKNDNDEYIDHIDGVCVCQKVEWSYTAKEFLETINYPIELINV